MAHSNDRILSIKQLTRYIKARLESDNLLQDVWIRGEISNFTHHSSGHMYFTLKDKDSRVRAIMFASHNQKLGFLPREGTKVIARGNVSIYERDGQYQFYVMQMQPDGIGSLYMAFEQLKQKLEAEGLFAAANKREIPRFPRTIGVITSPTGAAVRDIVTTLQRRYPAAAILLHPVVVQGTHAAASIAAAIDVMNVRQEVDVLIIGRGGGSLEELWAFNEEVVARSIHASTLPIISAVGHETDYTIADFVADLRAATPTAAAELAVPHHLEVTQQVYYLTQRLQKGLFDQLQRKKTRLQQLLYSSYFRQPHKQLLQPAERLDRLNEQLHFQMSYNMSRAKEKLATLERALASFNPRQQVIYARKRTETSYQRLVRAMQAISREMNQQLTAQIRQLDALSPLKVMQRGYSLIYDEQQQHLIKSMEQVQLGDLLKIKLTDGQLDCQVWSMGGKEDEDGGNTNRSTGSATV